MTKIGVFDSGIGGKSVAEKLEKLFPDAEVIFVSDSKHVPYGSHRPSEIAKLTERAIQPLLDAKCDAIVIACNTATTNAISELRKNHPDVHFVGIEPMIKPAAKLTKTHTIGVLATPATLHSHRYRQLKLQWAPRTTVIEPDCRTWADLIEKGESERIDIKSTVNELLRWDVDVIVLGCTHYHWLKERIERAAGPHVKILEPSDAIGARVESLIPIKSVLPE